MKKLINHPASVVREMLEGAVALAPMQRLLAQENVVVRAQLPEAATRPVALLSGGGSGHEPAHAGYVGHGMLTAAVAGDVFTSPSTDAVLAGIHAAAGRAGALLIVKNYTGDRLNFGLAAELARAEGIPVEIVVVADDVSLRDLVEPDRRRGIAGTVLIHKIAGAAAASGKPLAEVARIARAAAADVGSMGVALSACTLPGVGKPSFELGAAEIELGLGIHGEPGVERAGMERVEILVERLLDCIVADRGFAAGDRLALLVNGLGATPPMELACVARDALGYLRVRGFDVQRAWCGTLLSALDMSGFSLSLLRVDDARLALLDAATDAPAWPGPGRVAHDIVAASTVTGPDIEPVARVVHSASANPRLRRAAMAVADALLANEERLTGLDARAGDGDLGLSMARGASAIAALPDGAWASSHEALTQISHALRRAIGGSSGPFYATATLRAARALSGTPAPTALQWAEAFLQAVEAVRELGGAKMGDRTMVDALQPAAEAFNLALRAGAAPAQAWAAAVSAARKGCEATAHMPPRLGRASYLGKRALGVADAGATAVVCWLDALSAHIG